MFALTMVAEARTLQNRPYLREIGDMEQASEEEISGANPNKPDVTIARYSKFSQELYRCQRGT